MENGDLIAANDYRHSCVPCKLYKFYPNNILQTRIRTLREEKLWLSRPDKLNDPFEFSAFYYSDLFLEFQQDIQLSLNDNFYIGSLSANTFESPIMWAHYGGNHAGFCVEYEVKNPRFIWNVYYSQNRIKFDNGLRKVLIKSKDGEANSIEQGVFMQSLFYKSDEWEYEHEYRIVLPSEIVMGEKIDGQAHTICELGLQTKRVFAGWKASSSLIQKLRKSATMLDCEFLEVTPSQRKFRMEIVDNGTSEI